MVLRTAQPGLGRYCAPGKGARNVLAGAAALATFAACNDADWSNGALSISVVHAGDIDLTPLLKSEIDHAGA